MPQKYNEEDEMNKIILELTQGTKVPALPGWPNTFMKNADIHGGCIFMKPTPEISTNDMMHGQTKLFGRVTQGAYSLLYLCRPSLPGVEDERTFQDEILEIAQKRLKQISGFCVLF